MQPLQFQDLRKTSPAPVGLSVSEMRGLLEGVVGLSREWSRRLSVRDPQREKVLNMSCMAEALLSGGDYSPVALGALRAQLCANCRRLEPARGCCAGGSLAQCPLLHRVA